MHWRTHLMAIVLAGGSVAGCSDPREAAEQPQQSPPPAPRAPVVDHYALEATDAGAAGPRRPLVPACNANPDPCCRNPDLPGCDADAGKGSEPDAGVTPDAGSCESK